MTQKHPDGSVQALSSAATGLFALLVAFIGVTSFGSHVTAPWQTIDILHLAPSVAAGIFLASVPWLATQQRAYERDKVDETGKSVEAARTAFAIGAALTISAIAVFLVRDFWDSLQWPP